MQQDPPFLERYSPSTAPASSFEDSPKNPKEEESVRSKGKEDYEGLQGHSRFSQYRSLRFLHFRRFPVRLIIPNAITLIGLCAGLSGLRECLLGNMEKGVLFVLIACVIDGMDGRIARAIRGTSIFGAELDSLADFVNFGVVPGLVLYHWGMANIGRFGWIATLFYVVCCAMRLARFNAALQKPSAHPSPAAHASHASQAAKFFVGVPAPFGAILAFLPIYISFVVPAFNEKDVSIQVGICLFMFVIGVLLISTIPTFSLKKFPMHVSKTVALPLIICIVVAAIILWTYTWFMLIALCLIYVSLIPLSIYTHAKWMEDERKLGGTHER